MRRYISLVIEIIAHHDALQQFRVPTVLSAGGGGLLACAPAGEAVVSACSELCFLHELEPFLRPSAGVRHLGDVFRGHSHFAPPQTECHRGGGDRSRLLLLTVLVVAFGGLVVFKYLDFINGSVVALLRAAGCEAKVPRFNLILPIGISFYTFQAVGYVVDVYKGKIEPERDISVYALFVAFFPQTAAGPIGRAGQLIPQIRQQARFSTANITAGLRWMLWGYFMKVVVADRLALYTDTVFGNIAHHTGMSMLVAAVFFSFQIYCDFAGYSFLALGCAKTMGYDLIQNFRRPYMATSVQDFWRRWHISLSTWFRDYVYIPLGGSRCSRRRTYMNLMITFLLSGLWHGASWTFVVWGGLNGLFQIIGNVIKPIKERLRKACRLSDDSRVLRTFNILVTFCLLTVAWVFFKAPTFGDACMAVTKMALPTGTLYFPDLSTIFYCVLGVVIVLGCDIAEERLGRHPLLANRNVIVRFASYVGLALLIMSIGVFDGGQFIYFKF